MNVLNATELFLHLKMAHFMLCGFSLNKTKIRKPQIDKTDTPRSFCPAFLWYHWFSEGYAGGLDITMLKLCLLSATALTRGRPLAWPLPGQSLHLSELQGAHLSCRSNRVCREQRHMLA